ncbi:Undecaprenyl-diphosphatase [Catenulispora acidiphila DSM 44928]|uniref:Undecaprenyl-diphosphatase n=1 Tax=Catenulispora acidiphila (strain DSM 44928 / JCM 14897 / NBRC 102108 / NRRL B-24433 / ID139908) TaxID=479433 RepID=C7QB78_CATAD|nr:Undecaprenyl-diphosphatase [Catenulispora acidiphila DSM 44928]
MLLLCPTFTVCFPELPDAPRILRQTASIFRQGYELSGLNYLEACTIGLVQGVTELFPISSLGHSIILPAFIGGSWKADLDMTAKDSPYLAFLVLAHVATALALVAFFWRDWVRIIRALFTSVKDRSVETADQRLAWLLVVGTIPVGLIGIVADKELRTHLGKPIPAAIFLLINGFVIFLADSMLKSSSKGRHADDGTTPATHGESTEIAADRRLARLGWKSAAGIGGAQAFALLPGISRSGITMVAGLARGLKTEDAARFAFLLATPVILAAGVYKAPELAKPANHSILGPAVAGSVLAGIAAYISVRFLTKYFENRDLKPFGVYCVIAGIVSLVWFSVHH